MCLIVVAWKADPDYPLIVAANRDEFFARATFPAHWWPDTPTVLAGRDLVGHGTWLGLNRNGRFAALTNYRDPALQREGLASRGKLVSGFLAGDDSPLPALETIGDVSADYAAFNLLAGDRESLGIHESTTAHSRLLEPGIHGLSNHLLGTPWPKLQRARERFRRAVEGSPSDDAFLALLRDDTRAPDDQLPATGIGHDWERMLSSVFIRAPGYGTRSSTLIRIHRSGAAMLREWTWNADGEMDSEVIHRFALASPYP